MKDLLNRFRHAKRILVDSGELAMQSWYDYQQAALRLTKVLGENLLVENIGPEHFEKLRADYSKTWKAVRIGGEINRVRIMFGYAFKNNLVDKPARSLLDLGAKLRESVAVLSPTQRAAFGKLAGFFSELAKAADEPG